MEKGLFVKDITAANIEVKGLFRAKNPSLRKTRAGKPFWSLSLADISGSIAAVIWTPPADSIHQIDEGEIMFVSGASSSYNNNLQVNVQKLIKLDAETLLEVDENDFIVPSRINADNLLIELIKLSENEFTHSGWKNLILPMLEDENLAKSLKSCPAAKQMHHDYCGGLLEHTLSVFKICQSMADHYGEMIDRQALLAGALLHDIGKIREFCAGMGIDYTDEGRLMGHIFLGMEIIQPFLLKSGLEPPLQEHLKHLILSHHGLQEYGSPCVPQTMESFILHAADDLDAKIGRCRAAVENLDGNESRWSPWQDCLKRYIYRSRQTSDFS